MKIKTACVVLAGSCILALLVLAHLFIQLTVQHYSRDQKRAYVTNSHPPGALGKREGADPTLCSWLLAPTSEVIEALHQVGQAAFLHECQAHLPHSFHELWQATQQLSL